MTPSPSPASQLLYLRTQYNQQQLALVISQNAAKTALYAQRVYQLYTVPKYIQTSPGEQPPVIPDPPLLSTAVQQPLTPYDQQWALPAEIDSVEGPATLPRYVDPGPPPVTPQAMGVVQIVAQGQNGEWVPGPKDTMPVGIPVKAPDGSWVQKYSASLPWGTAYWYGPPTAAKTAVSGIVQSFT